ENSTAIMAALPAMATSLRTRPATVEWAVNAYLLASAVFIIMGGEVADLFGARRSSAAGCVLFALASLMMVVSPNGIVVVGARALQGLGAAFAVAGTLAAATQAVPEAERAKAVGAWTGFLLLGFSIGPLVGGVVTHYAGWRVNFALTGLANAIRVPFSTLLCSAIATSRSDAPWRFCSCSTSWRCFSTTICSRRVQTALA